MKSIARYTISLFFLLTIVLAWAIWIPGVLAKLQGVESPLSPASPLGGLARWTPGLVAIFLVALISGRAGVGDLFRPLRIGRVNILWYAFAIGFEPMLFFAAKGIDTLLGHPATVVSPLMGALVATYGTQAAVVLPFVFIFAIPGTLAEELGWRGYALPHLQARNSAFVSSLVIGLIWGIWHIPSMIYSGMTPGEIASSVFITIPMAIFYSVLYNNTNGSLLLVTLFHLAQQFSRDLLGTWPSNTDEILVCLLAFWMIVALGTANLSRSHSRVQKG